MSDKSYCPPPDAVPPFETDIERCEPSVTDSGQTDASISVTSGDCGDGLSYSVSDLTPTSENSPSSIVSIDDEDVVPELAL